MEEETLEGMNIDIKLKVAIFAFIELLVLLGQRKAKFNNLYTIWFKWCGHPSYDSFCFDVEENFSVVL